MTEFDLEGKFKTLAKKQEREEETILGMSNVVGVAVGNKVTKGRDTKKPCISVFVSQKLDRELVPEEHLIEGESFSDYDVVETGEIFADAPQASAAEREMELKRDRLASRLQPYTRPSAADGATDLIEPPPWQRVETTEEVAIEALRQRRRPVKGGYSVGHYRVTAGTMATAVHDRRPFPGIPRRYYILSNNHVLANSNAARIGDPILQPGRADGGTIPRDVIARLSAFVTIYFDGRPNLVDAAIAEADFHEIDREIYWIGYPRGVRVLNRIGEIVQKTGRTTNYTTGRVTHLNATVKVNYGGGRLATMARQIVTTNMAAGGDSGSCLCDMDGNAVGLLFAGSSRVTIHNHMRFVEKLLDIRIAPSQ